MQATVNGSHVEVRLSRTNLFDLLAALDAGVTDKSLLRRTDSGVVLQVIPEEDDQHYGNRQPGPGFRALQPIVAVENHDEY